VSGRWNIVDQPYIVDLGLAVLVVVHAVVTILGWVPSAWTMLAAASRGEQAALYLAVLGAAALLSGFAGVVVIFGLSGTTDRFRTFRVKAGPALARNWTSTSIAGFAGAGTALLAAILLYSPWASASPWLFELAVLLVAHSSTRLVWLLRGLIRLVQADDVSTARERNKKSPKDGPWNQRRPA
jgi:hypothetical protein